MRSFPRQQDWVVLSMVHRLACLRRRLSLIRFCCVRTSENVRAVGSGAQRSLCKRVRVHVARGEIAMATCSSRPDAPLLPVLEEAGGTFTDWNGVRTIDGGNSIATNGVLFDEVMSLVRNKDADNPGN